MTTVGCLPPQQAHDAVGDHGGQRAEQRHGRQGKREENPPRSNSMSAGNRARKGAPITQQAVQNVIQITPAQAESLRQTMETLEAEGKVLEEER